jgi:hypothetical protein
LALPSVLQGNPEPGSGCLHEKVNTQIETFVQGGIDMKSVFLLTIAMFLVAAPAPDGESLSELSGGFLVSGGGPVLLAAEWSPVCARPF